MEQETLILRQELLWFQV